MDALIQSIRVVQRVGPPEHGPSGIYGHPTGGFGWPRFDNLGTAVWCDVGIREAQVPERLMPRCKARGESAGLTEIGIELKMMNLGFPVAYSRIKKYHRLGRAQNRISLDARSVIGNWLLDQLRIHG